MCIRDRDITLVILLAIKRQKKTVRIKMLINGSYWHKSEQMKKPIFCGAIMGKYIFGLSAKTLKTAILIKQEFNCNAINKKQPHQ